MDKFNSFYLENSGNYLYGFNPKFKVDKISYKRYVSFVTAITEILKGYDICIRYNGYTYIVDAVMLILDQSGNDIKLSNDVYPYIRDKYQLKNSSMVEHSIRNAIKTAYLRSRGRELSNQMSYYDKKPTNKQFLLTLTADVCCKMSTELLSSPV